MKERWRQDGTGTPEGWWLEGRGSHDQREPLSERVSAGMGRELQGIGGSEGNVASVSPMCSNLGKPAGVLA